MKAHRPLLLLSSLFFCLPIWRNVANKCTFTAIYQTGVLMNSISYHYHGSKLTRVVDVSWNIVGGAMYMGASVFSKQIVPMLCAGTAFACFALGLHHNRPQIIHVVMIHIPCWLSFWNFDERLVSSLLWQRKDIMTN